MKCSDVADVEICLSNINAQSASTRGLKMASIAAVQFRIMPQAVDSDLESIKLNLEKKLKSFKGAVFNSIVEEPVAFGLKALIFTFALPESEEVDLVQNAMQKVKGISSVELKDYRRAVG